MSPFEQQVLAMGGIYQAATLARDIARTGTTDAFAYRASVRSIFMLNAADTISIFGGIDGIRRGLDELAGNTMQRNPADNMEIVRYAIALSTLAGKLMGDKPMLEVLRERIVQAEAENEQSATISPETIEHLANLYRETISTLTPRIMVRGEQHFLQHEDSVNRIRAVLLSGVRAGVLWRQLGGGRISWLFRRRQYALTAAALVNRERLH